MVREMLLGHLDIVRAGDVLILDRGYPSHEMLRILLDHGVDFVVRVPATHSFEAIHGFRERDGDASTILNELSTVCLDSSNASPELATSDDRDDHAHGGPSSLDLAGVPRDVVELNGIWAGAEPR